MRYEKLSFAVSESIIYVHCVGKMQRFVSVKLPVWGGRITV